MISVIIPVYNEEKYIERCLKSLENQTVPRNEFEVILVDGHSKDRTVEIAKKYVDKVIQQKSEGIGCARNDGAKVSKGEIIATTDADSIPFKNWIEVIQKNFRDKKIVCLYGLQEPIDIAEKFKKMLKNVPKTKIKIRIKLAELKSKIFCLQDKMRIKLAENFGCYLICGANVAFDKKSFEKIGGFDNLPILDDYEIGLRLKPLGKIVLDTHMRIGCSIRRLEKKGALKTSILFTISHIKLFFKKKIKLEYCKEEYD